MGAGAGSCHARNEARKKREKRSYLNPEMKIPVLRSRLNKSIPVLRSRLNKSVEIIR